MEINEFDSHSITLNLAEFEGMSEREEVCFLGYVSDINNIAVIRNQTSKKWIRVLRIDPKTMTRRTIVESVVPPDVRQLIKAAINGEDVFIRYEAHQEFLRPKSLLSKTI